MLKYRIQIFVLGLVGLMLVSACSEESEPVSNGTGAIAAKAVWTPESHKKSLSAGSSKNSHPPAVVIMRATISGPDMESQIREFNIEDHAGSISGVPAGVNRTLTLEGVDASDICISRGVFPGITVTTGGTTEPVTVSMTAASDTGLEPAAPIISSPASSFYTSNGKSTPGLTLSGECLDGHTVSLFDSEDLSMVCTGSAFSFNLSLPDSDDSYPYSIIQTSDFTGLSSVPSSFVWNLDTTAPGLPAITSYMSNPVVTAGSTLSLIGTCETGATVHLLSNNSTPDNLTVPCATDVYSFTLTNPVDGASITYTIDQADAAGNTSSAVSKVWTRNDALLFTTTPTDGLTTSEDGGTAQFTVVLNNAPSADVTIAVSSGDTSEVTTSTSLLTFTNAD